MVEIQAEDLHKSFGDAHVLSGIDLTVQCGEMVAIVGGSGCGKTVLMQHLIGHLQPDRGRVLVADHNREGAPLVDLATLDEEGKVRVRVHSAVVFQRNALFSGTVFENVAFWLREIAELPPETIEERVREALEAVGLIEEEGILEKQRDELSGGMAKRVALARALAMHPVVTYYDEPTTGLDPANAALIHEVLHHAHARKPERAECATSVIITHDKDLLRRLEPRVVMLDDGRVHFDGPYEEFARSDSPVVRPYFEQMPVLHQRDAAA